MIGIYKITCGGKVFIGRSVELEAEWEKHKAFAKVGRTHFYNALRKDLAKGAAAFQIITECELSRLNELQEYYILKYDSYFNGWNTSLGGDYEYQK